MPHPAQVRELIGKHAATVGGATITVGDESSDVINVAIQLEDVWGNDLAEIGVVEAYLSDDSGGDGVAASAPSGGVAIGTDGSIIVEYTADKVFKLQSESDGDIDLDLTLGSTEADTFYLVVVLPSGKIVVSDAITFTSA